MTCILVVHMYMISVHTAIVHDRSKKDKMEAGLMWMLTESNGSLSEWWKGAVDLKPGFEIAASLIRIWKVHQSMSTELHENENERNSQINH